MSTIIPDEVHAPTPVFTGTVTKSIKVSPSPMKGSKKTNLNRKQHHIKKKKGK